MLSEGGGYENSGNAATEAREFAVSPTATEDSWDRQGEHVLYHCRSVIARGLVRSVPTWSRDLSPEMLPRSGNRLHAAIQVARDLTQNPQVLLVSIP